MKVIKKPAMSDEQSGPIDGQICALRGEDYSALKQYTEVLELDNDSIGSGYQAVLIAFCDLLESQGPAWSQWLIENRYRHQLPESVMTDIRHMLNLPLVEMGGAA